MVLSDVDDCCIAAVYSCCTEACESRHGLTSSSLHVGVAQIRA